MTLFANSDAGVWQTGAHELVFGPEQGGASKRIPAVAVTSGGAFLVATEQRPTTSDGSLTGIYLARRMPEGTWTYDLETLACNAGGWGKFMNPSFTVDRAGTHGPAGRIFLFFLATTTPSGMAMHATPEEIATCYVWSDDDGVTWSEIVRVPAAAWESWPYDWMVPSPANGIQTPDGSLFIPCMGRAEGHWYSSLLFKRPGSDWAYSPATETAEDNESTCYTGPDGDVYLNCRNEADGHVRNLYRYDAARNRFTKVENPFDPNLVCQGTVCAASCGGRDLYLMSFCEPSRYNRRNWITVWVSADALRWAPLLRLTGERPSAGYSAIAFHDGLCAVVWEDDPAVRTICFRDLSPLLRSSPTRRCGTR